MDPQGEAPERVQSLLQVAPHPVEEDGSPGRVGVDQPAGMLQVDREPDQVLLGTVVQLALDPAPVGIGSEHEPLPRRSQLLDLGAQAVARAPPMPRSADPSSATASCSTMRSCP